MFHEVVSVIIIIAYLVLSVIWPNRVIPTLSVNKSIVTLPTIFFVSLRKALLVRDEPQQCGEMVIFIFLA